MLNFLVLALISGAYVVVCICCLVECAARQREKKKILSMPGYMVWVGVICGAIFLVLAWVGAGQGAGVGTSIVFGLLTLLGLALMLGWKNGCIIYDASGFTRRNLLGKKRSYTYAQVTGWSMNELYPTESYLYTDKGKISFNLIGKNGADFLSTLVVGYQKANHGKKLPMLSGLREEGGGFRAHVYNPGEYLAIFIILLLFFLGMGAFCVFTVTEQINEADCEVFTLQFQSCVVEKNEIVLTAAEIQEEFMIWYCEEHMPLLDRLQEKCNGETVFTVYAKSYNGDDDPSYYRVYSLADGGEYYLRFEDANACRREDLPGIIALFGGFVAVLLSFSFLVYKVGCNPRRFPKWVVNACFKEGAIRF